MPEDWAKDKGRRKKTKIPIEIEFQTKPNIALEQVRQAVAEQVPQAPVLADAAYGNDSGFREEITNLGLIEVCSGSAVFDEGMAAWGGPFAEESVERQRTSAKCTAAR